MNEETYDAEQRKEDLAKIKKAVLAGRITCEPEKADCFNRMDLKNPDHTLTSVKLSAWGPWKKNEDGHEHGNDGGPVFSWDWNATRLGCGHRWIKT